MRRDAFLVAIAALLFSATTWSATMCGPKQVQAIWIGDDGHLWVRLADDDSPGPGPKRQALHIPDGDPDYAGTLQLATTAISNDFYLAVRYAENNVACEKSVPVSYLNDTVRGVYLMKTDTCAAPLNCQ